MHRTEEFTEVVPGNPEQLFGAMKNQHEWLPKVAPHVFTDGKRHHEGEGGAGSEFHYDIHEDTHDAHGGSPNVKMVLEEYNPETLSVVVDYQADPRYSHLKYIGRFLPGPSPNTTYIKWCIDYAPLTADTPPPGEFLIHLPVDAFKDLAAHLNSQSRETVDSVSVDSVPVETVDSVPVETVNSVPAV